MFNKAKKHASRVGLRPVKALFSIQIVSVTLPRSTPIVDQAILSACFERGGKISATKNVTYEKPAFVREVVVEFDEKVELMATLYKDFKTGRYQEKQALLILREQTKHRFGHDSYKGWGKYNLNLHELLNELGFDRTRTKEMTVKLELLIGVTMKIIVTSTIVSTGKDDETMSVSSYMSDASEMSTLAASFSHVNSVGASMSASKQNSANSTIHTSSLENTAEKDNWDVDVGDVIEEPDSQKESQEPVRDAAPAANSAPRTFVSYFNNPFASTTNAFDYKSDKYSIPESPATGHEVEVSQHSAADILKDRADSDAHSEHDAKSSDSESDSGKKTDTHRHSNSNCKGPAPSTAVVSPVKGPASSESWHSTQSKPSSTYRSPQAAAHTTDTSSTSPTLLAPHPATTRQRFQDLLHHRSAHKEHSGTGPNSGAAGAGTGAESPSVASGSEDHSPRRFGWNRKRHDSDGHSESGDAAEDSSPSASASASGHDVNHADSNGAAEHHRDRDKDKGYKKGFFSRVMKPLTHHHHAHGHTQNHNHKSAHHDLPDPLDVAHLNSPASELPQPDSSRSHSTEASKEAFALYDTELQRRGTHIARLEQALADQSAHSAAQIAALKAELTSTAAALRKEKVARAVIAEVTHKGDDVLAAALSEARDEAARAVAERAALLDELEELREEAALHREQVAQLRQQQAQEMELSQQAAAVAASASVRRAEAEDEAQQLLDQLISVKMEHANMSMELEETRRSNSLLHRRLQSYAQQVAALEVKYAHSLQQRENGQDDDGSRQSY